MARGFAEVGLEVSSGGIRNQMKKRGGTLLAEASPKEDTAPSPREDTAPVQENCINQESEVLPLYGAEGAEEQAPQREIWMDDHVKARLKIKERG